MGVGILSPRPERGRRFFRYPPSPPALTRLPARISQPGPHPQPRRLGRIALAPPPQIRHSRHSQDTDCPRSLGNPAFAVNSLLNLPPDRRRVTPSLRPPSGGQISRAEPPGPQPGRRSPSRFLSLPLLSSVLVIRNANIESSTIPTANPHADPHHLGKEKARCPPGATGRFSLFPRTLWNGHVPPDKGEQSFRHRGR